MPFTVVLINFGEPESGDVGEAERYLERIFLANARLESADLESGRGRSSELARRRAPGLAAEYAAIGGSPLNRQAWAQAAALGAELERRGVEAEVVAAMQFTDPDIGSAVVAAGGSGSEGLIGLPAYPLCGPSTTVAALAELRRAAESVGGPPIVAEITGWHAHAAYTSLRAAGIRGYCDDRGVDLAEAGTRLVFAAHGTPLKYLAEGVRYDVYVRDHCRRLAAALGVADYVIGYQNHGNRPGVEWTAPEVERVVAGLAEDGMERVVVVPVSFMTELSETLSELDLELADQATALGLDFHRVPIPHDDPAFAAILADLVEPFLMASDPSSAALGGCACRPGVGAYCLNRRPGPGPA